MEYCNPNKIENEKCLTDILTKDRADLSFIEKANLLAKYKTYTDKVLIEIAFNT